MPTNNHSVKDVLEDKSLVDPEVLESPQVARRYAKGIVLSKENNEAGQIRSSRAVISLLRERGFDVSVGNQNKHYVHGLGLEAEETETWVN